MTSLVLSPSIAYLIFQVMFVLLILSGMEFYYGSKTLGILFFGIGVQTNLVAINFTDDEGYGCLTVIYGLIASTANDLVLMKAR